MHVRKEITAFFTAPLGNSQLPYGMVNDPFTLNLLDALHKLYKRPFSKQVLPQVEFQLGGHA
jgi:hypothetical protein